jgi:hypothetical protein
MSKPLILVDMEKHSNPCVQEIRIGHLEGDVKQINTNIDRLFEIIDGNGKPGMKTDLKIACLTIEQIEKKLSAKVEIETELEIQRRVAAEAQKIKEKYEAKKIKRIELFLAGIAILISLAALIFKSWN